MKKTLNNIYTFLFLFAISFSARAQGLSNVKSVFENFRTELTVIVPIIAVCVLIGLGIAYATGVIQKQTLVRWGIGVIIAGSAGPITAVFMPNANIS